MGHQQQIAEAPAHEFRSYILLTKDRVKWQDNALAEHPMKKRQIARFYASSFPTAKGEEKDKGKLETVARLVGDERSTRTEIHPSAYSG